jgi:hypothetical protein
MLKYSIGDKFRDGSYLLGATDNSITPVAGIFSQTDEDGLTKVKTSNSTFQNVDISNDPSATFTHDFIVNGTISIKIKGNGGQSIALESSVLSASELTEVETLISGNMDSVNGYTINEYLLIYKLIVWGYINQTYTKTIKPYVLYNSVQNQNDATELLDYSIPVSVISLNEAATIRTDCLVVIWSDGSVTDCQGIDSEVSGAGIGNVYLFGNYTIFDALLIRSITSFSNINDNTLIFNIDKNENIIIEDGDIGSSIQELGLGNTASTLTNFSLFTNLIILTVSRSNVVFDTSEFNNLDNIQSLSAQAVQTISGNYNFTNQTGLIELDFFNSRNVILTDISHLVNLEILNLYNTGSVIPDVSANTALTNLNLSQTNSVIPDVSANTALTNLNLSQTNSAITDVSANTALTNLNLSQTNSAITDVSANTALTNLNLSQTNSAITDVSANTALTNLNLSQTNSAITDVSANTALTYLNLADANNVGENNTLIQNIIDFYPTKGNEELIITYDAALNQTNINTIVTAGWDVTQNGQP